MNDHDDLDELERELGASLRLALHRAAAPITEAQRPPAPSLSPNRSVTRGARFDDVADDLEVLEPKRAEVIVVDLEPTPDEPAAHRRWLVVAAAVVTIAVLIGSVLAWAATNDGGRSVPVGPGTTSTTVLRSPATNASLLPKGAPSLPEHGTVVAAIAFSHQSSLVPLDTSITVFADGRLISNSAEQRLTADGVERMRQEFLTVGALKAGQPGAGGVWWTCNCIIRVRDGGRLLSSDASSPPKPPVDPELERQVDHLAEFVTHPESSLPPSAWADRQRRSFVPSKYRVGVWIEGEQNKAVPDLSNELRQVLSAPLRERLDAQGWAHTPFEDSVAVTLADARQLAKELADAGLSHSNYGYYAQLIFQLGIGMVPVSTSFSIKMEPLLPNGEPPLGAPS